VKNALTFRRFALLTGLLIGSYLLLRAWINEPLHDEIATYYFYIYQGDFWGENMVVDANNHLLNSFVCHLMYPFAKDTFFWYRLPNICCFFLYLYFSYKWLNLLENKTLKYLGLLTLCGIPYMMEYFAYTRGYGMSMALLMGSIWHLRKYLLTPSFKSLSFSLLFILMAISANLTLLYSSLIIIGILFLHLFFINKEDKRFLALLPLVPSLIIVVLFVIYGMMLKNAGALYYGERDGYWLVTGRSLSKYIFYNDGWLSALILLVMYLSIGFIGIKSAIKAKLEFIKHPLFLPSVLILGNMAGTVLSALILEVNYPEDRTAMYLIPLTGLALVFTLDQLPKALRQVQWLLLFFPLTFIWKLNLHTSVFSPDDRMTNDFYAQVKPHIKPEHSLMVYGIMTWNWPMHESHSKIKASVYNSYNTNAPLTDFILSKTTILRNPKIAELYDTIAQDPDATYIALKRKWPMIRETIRESQPVSFQTDGEFGNIAQFDSLPPMNGQPVQITVTGHLKTKAEKNKLQLVVQTVNEKGEMIDYHWYPFETVYQGQEIDDDFTHHFVIDQFDNNERTVKAYIWNRQRDAYELRDGKCYIYELKEKQHGSR
jgi:hypothetical protein